MKSNKLNPIFIHKCRPPHGGRGLKSCCSTIELQRHSRPPHGGRGLKSATTTINAPVVIVAPRTGGVG